MPKFYQSLVIVKVVYDIVLRRSLVFFVIGRFGPREAQPVGQDYDKDAFGASFPKHKLQHNANTKPLVIVVVRVRTKEATDWVNRRRPNVRPAQFQRRTV